MACFPGFKLLKVCNFKRNIFSNGNCHARIVLTEPNFEVLTMALVVIIKINASDNVCVKHFD